MSEPVACHKRWVVVLSYAVFLVLLCLMFLALMLINLFSEPHSSILAGLLALFFVYWFTGFYINFCRTTLYVHPDGFAYRFGKWPIRLIRWEDIERPSERYVNGFSTAISLRLKQYATFLNQLEGDEIRLFLCDRRAFVWLSNLTVKPVKPEALKELWPEGIGLSKKDPRTKMAWQMMTARYHSGVDLVFSSLLCKNRDMDAIEASYVKWLENREL